MILYTFISMLFNPLRTFLCLAKYLTEVQGSVFIHEKSGRILFANPYFRKKLQYRNRELMLKKYEDIMHPEDVGASEAYRLEHGALGKVFQGYRNRYRRKDGEYVVCEWSGTRIMGIYLCDVEIYKIEAWKKS